MFVAEVETKLSLSTYMRTIHANSHHSRAKMLEVMPKAFRVGYFILI